MIIDAHAHIEGTRCDETKKIVMRAIERYGIDRVYISALQGYTPNEETVSELNYETYKFMREEPKHIGGYAYISPKHKNATEVVKQAVEEYGMEGLKLWVSTYCDDPHVYPVVEKAIDYGIPILIHAFYKVFDQLPNETRGSHVANLARRYPEAKLIMAHLGGNCYDGIPPIKDCKNVWVDFSGSIFRSNDLNYTVSAIGAERIIFGTDIPISFVDSYGQVLEADLTEEECEMILYRNAQKIFDKSYHLESEGVR